MNIESLWRYPVKSMAGEKLDQAALSHNGVVGDRSYAVHDGQAPCRAKKYAQLMRCSARFDGEPDGITIPPVTLDLPQGTIRSDDPNINQALSSELEVAATLDQLRPADDLDYYRRPATGQSMAEIRLRLGLEADEPLPDFSEFPKELFQFSTPPGTFYDAYPLLILTTSSMNTLQQAIPSAAIDVRRFRPNLVINTEPDTGYIEEHWKNRCLVIGEVVIALTLPCPRCAMTTIAFQDLPREPKIMRTLVQENHHRLGIYGQVLRPGKITPGDAVVLKDLDQAL